MTGSPQELRQLAERTARDAGLLASNGRRARNVPAPAIERTTKSSRTDMVTEFDRAAEALVVEAIRTHRPNDAIIGEEGASVSGTSGFVWHVDPIDGTTNFVYDLPTWCVSVGVEFDSQMIAGAVYIPILDEMFSAARGHGATLNGAAIQANAETDLGSALVGTGFSFVADVRRAQAALVAGLIGQVRDIRRLGSAAIDLCFVAAGRLDAYYEQFLNSWDIAAGVLIASEAGAIPSDFAGAPPRPAELVVAAPGIHLALLGALGRASGTILD